VPERTLSSTTAENVEAAARPGIRTLHFAGDDAPTGSAPSLTGWRETRHGGPAAGHDSHRLLTLGVRNPRPACPAPGVLPGTVPAAPRTMVPAGPFIESQQTA
jgi:hypothetical protein